MTKRIKVLITASMLLFSLALMTFGVYAATNHTLGVENYISFDIEDNISFNIEALTALGATPDVVYNNAPQTNKISLSVDMSGVASGTNANVMTNGWSPWTSNSPAILDISKDTIYWMFKITNTCSNPIQVRVTNEEDNTLFTMDSKMRLYKKFGTSGTSALTETSSGEIAFNNTIYLLVALEANSKEHNLNSEWNFKIHIEKANASYLKTDWYSSLSSGIKTIEFLGGDGNAYNGVGTKTYTFGATDKNGTAVLTTETDTIKQITGYVNGTALYIHSPAIIYAPVNSSNLFNSNGTKLSTVTNIAFNNFDTCNVNNMNSMFNYSVANFDLSNFDTANVTDMMYMFQKCSMANLNLDNFDTANVVTMRQMFFGCVNLTELNLLNFDTSKVENMMGLFGVSMSESSKLKIVNNNFNTGKVTNMSSMFQNCQSLESIDVSNWDTSEVTSMSNMFVNCYKLTNINVSNWNTSKVTNMSGLFSSQSSGTLTAMSLTKLDVSNWDVSNVSSMNMMFQGCSNLTELDLQKWTTSAVTNMSYMFYACNGLVKLNLYNFYIRTDCNVSYMLNLMGNNGTTTAIKTLVTPKYVGKAIDIKTLGFAQTSIEVNKTGSASITLTK